MVSRQGLRQGHHRAAARAQARLQHGLDHRPHPGEEGIRRPRGLRQDPPLPSARGQGGLHPGVPPELRPRTTSATPTRTWSPSSPRTGT
ncbi:MAG: hypothetical protein MZV64_11005 [Ignavibacteriales bacterium]|nr:hypothetical protein [Ignavibacteriales bacterium]